MAELWDPAPYWNALSADAKQRVGRAAMASAYAAAVDGIDPGRLRDGVLQGARSAADVTIASTLLRRFPKVFDHPLPPLLADMGVRQCRSCGILSEADSEWPSIDWCTSCARHRGQPR